VTLDAETAGHLARAGLDNVAREYPHHPGHLLTGLDDLAEPHGLHPVFFGSYDWHSAVHQHWLLLRLLRRHPDLPERKRIHAWFDDRLTTTNVATEVACFDHPARRTFEWLAITPYLHRAGAHANSAYACRLLVEVCQVHDDAELAARIDAAATRWYLDVPDVAPDLAV